MGWKEKLLSQVEKEILIKAVAQAITTYTMSVFKLLDSLCDEMTSMVRKFWWGQKEGRNKMAWLSWEKMCAPEKDGGLGFRDLKAFNIALLAKQGRRLQSNTRSLVHRVLKACYFPDCDFIDAELGQTPSYAWRSIMVAQDVVRDGHQWQVGDGTSIQIWRDKWLPKSSTFRVIFMPNTLPETATVSELIDEAKGEWNVDLVKHVFLPDDAHTILGIPRSSKRNRDRMIWAYTPQGTFTVNSAYKVALSLSQSKSTEGTLDATSHS